MASTAFKNFLARYRDSAAWPSVDKDMEKPMETLIRKNAYGIWTDSMANIGQTERMIFFIELYLDFYEKGNDNHALNTTTEPQFVSVITKYAQKGSYQNEVAEINSELQSLHKDKKLWVDEGKTRVYTSISSGIAPGGGSSSSSSVTANQQIQQLQNTLIQQQQQANQIQMNQLTAKQQTAYKQMLANMTNLRAELATLKASVSSGQTVNAQQTRLLDEERRRVAELQREINDLKSRSGGGSLPPSPPVIVPVPIGSSPTIPSPDYKALEAYGIHSTSLAQFCRAVEAILKDGSNIKAFKAPWNTVIGSIDTLYQHEIHVAKSLFSRISPDVSAKLEVSTYDALLKNLTITPTAHVTLKNIVQSLTGWDDATHKKDLYLPTKEADFIRDNLLPIMQLFAHMQAHDSNAAFEDLPQLIAFLTGFGGASLLKAISFKHASPKVHAESLEYTFNDLASDANLFNMDSSVNSWLSICSLETKLVPSILQKHDFGYGMRPNESSVVALALGIVKGFKNPDSTLATGLIPDTMYDADYGILLLKALWMLTQPTMDGGIASLIKGVTLESLAKALLVVDKVWYDILEKAILLSCFLRAMSVYQKLALATTNFYLELQVSNDPYADNHAGSVPIITGLTMDPNAWGITDPHNIIDASTFRSALGRIAKKMRPITTKKKYPVDEIREDFKRFYKVPAGSGKIPIDAKTIDWEKPVTSYGTKDVQVPVAQKESVKLHETVTSHPAKTEPVRRAVDTKEKRVVKPQISPTIVESEEERIAIKTSWERLSSRLTKSNKPEEVSQNMTDMITYLFANAATLKDMGVSMNDPLIQNRKKFNDANPMPNDLALKLNSYGNAFRDFTTTAKATNSN